MITLLLRLPFPSPEDVLNTEVLLYHEVVNLHLCMCLHSESNQLLYEERGEREREGGGRERQRERDRERETVTETERDRDRVYYNGSTR